jgi:hypothetical protein
MKTRLLIILSVIIMFFLVSFTMPNLSKVYGSCEMTQDGLLQFAIGYQWTNGLLYIDNAECTWKIFGVIPIASILLEETSLSKQCDIPYDKNFIERSVVSGSNDGKPNFSIKGEFSIFHTVPIGEFSIDESAQSLILKPVPMSYGYIIMCDPLLILEKRLETKLNFLVILVDGLEIPYEIKNNVLRIDVNNNTSIEIVGFSKI